MLKQISRTWKLKPKFIVPSLVGGDSHMLLTFLLLTYISWKYIDVDRIEWRYPLFCYIFAACCIVQVVLLAVGTVVLLWTKWVLRNLLVLSYGAIAYSSSHLSTSSQSSGTVNVPYALPSCILLDRFDYISILR